MQIDFQFVVSCRFAYETIKVIANFTERNVAVKFAEVYAENLISEDYKRGFTVAVTDFTGEKRVRIAHIKHN